ncbi:MAG: SHOCT domain-containing protein [Selenomonadaceae bacterium]|nr:SHOCT domain-containing protein [Selenomonadaceae bacterium]
MPLNNPYSEKTTKRVVDESEVPEAIRKKINAQESLHVQRGMERTMNFPSYIYSERLNHWFEEDPTKKEAHNKQIANLRRIHHEHDGWKLTVYWDNVSTGRPNRWGEQVVTRSMSESELPEDIRKSINGKNKDSTHTTKRIVDESDVPEVVRRRINAQEAVPKVERPQESANQDKTLDAIKKLGDLYKVGILTEEEFTAKKKELLSRL